MEKTPIDYHLIATFIAVADETSFSKAARKLGIGKGTVSRAIARLEDLVGAELLHRTTHKVALSTAGTALYERTAPHLAALDQAVVRLPERAEQPSGDLRITAPHDFGVVVLPQVLSQFCLRYPDIRFDVRLTNTLIDLVAEGFDLAIRPRLDKVKSSSLIARRLCPATIGFYASPAYIARRGEPRQPGDADHEWVMFLPMLLRLRLGNGFRPRVVSDDFFLIRNLAREGVGVGVMPNFLAAPEVVAGTLVPVLSCERVPAGAGFFIVYPASGQVPRKLTAFRDFIIDHLKAHPID